MNIEDFSYCVAIRTLGTAGDKYLTTLRSLQAQTIQPKKILIYIAEGYSIPKETIGIEQYIYVKKGMVAQRALPYKEVDTEYILCLDDDLSFPPDMVENLYRSLNEFNADCISPNTFSNHNASFNRKITMALGAFVFPMKTNKWAFRIRKCGAYSYNNHPVKDAYLSQSAAFNCFLCKLSVYRAIHYEDELWLDQFKYALGDDQLFFYKLYINGYKLLVHYNTGIVHLSAQSGHSKNIREKQINSGMIDFLIWHRTCYLLYKKQGIKECSFCIMAYGMKVVTKLLYSFMSGIFKFQLYRPVGFIRGILKGFSFVKTKEYEMIPGFKLNNVKQ